MPASRSDSAPLERHGRNLTLLAQQGAFSPFDGQEAVIDRVFQEIQLIGTCTREHYRESIERDAAMQRRCQAICLPGNWEEGIPRSCLYRCL